MKKEVIDDLVEDFCFEELKDARSKLFDRAMAKVKAELRHGNRDRTKAIVGRRVSRNAASPWTLINRRLITLIASDACELYAYCVSDDSDFPYKILKRQPLTSAMQITEMSESDLEVIREDEVLAVQTHAATSYYEHDRSSTIETRPAHDTTCILITRTDVNNMKSVEGSYELFSELSQMQSPNKSTIDSEDNMSVTMPPEPAEITLGISDCIATLRDGWDGSDTSEISPHANLHTSPMVYAEYIPEVAIPSTSIVADAPSLSKYADMSSRLPDTPRPHDNGAEAQSDQGSEQQQPPKTITPPRRTKEVTTSTCLLDLSQESFIKEILEVHDRVVCSSPIELPKKASIREKGSIVMATQTEPNVIYDPPVKHSEFESQNGYVERSLTDHERRLRFNESWREKNERKVSQIDAEYYTLYTNLKADQELLYAEHVELKKVLTDILTGKVAIPRPPDTEDSMGPKQPALGTQGVGRDTTEPPPCVLPDPSPATPSTPADPKGGAKKKGSSVVNSLMKAAMRAIPQHRPSPAPPVPANCGKELRYIEKTTEVSANPQPRTEPAPKAPTNPPKPTDTRVRSNPQMGATARRRDAYVEIPDDGPSIWDISPPNDAVFPPLPEPGEPKDHTQRASTPMAGKCDLDQSWADIDDEASQTISVYLAEIKEKGDPLVKANRNPDDNTGNAAARPTGKMAPAGAAVKPTETSKTTNGSAAPPKPTVAPDSTRTSARAQQSLRNNNNNATSDAVRPPTRAQQADRPNNYPGRPAGDKQNHVNKDGGRYGGARPKTQSIGKSPASSGILLIDYGSRNKKDNGNKVVTRNGWYVETKKRKRTRTVSNPSRPLRGAKVKAQKDIFVRGLISEGYETVENFEDAICDYCEARGVEVYFIRITSQMEPGIANVKISICEDDLDEALDPAFWPENVTVREWYRDNSKDKKSGDAGV